MLLPGAPQPACGPQVTGVSFSRSDSVQGMTNGQAPCVQVLELASRAPHTCLAAVSGQVLPCLLAAQGIYPPGPQLPSEEAEGSELDL